VAEDWVQAEYKHKFKAGVVRPVGRITVIVRPAYTAGRPDNDDVYPADRPLNDPIIRPLSAVL